MTVARPQHNTRNTVCMPLSRVRAAAAPSSALDLCRCPRRALLATRGDDMVGKSRNMPADMLFMPGLLGLLDAADHLLCEVADAVCTLFVTEISGRATPRRHRCGVAQSSREALSSRPKLGPASHIVAS